MRVIVLLWMALAGAVCAGGFKFDKVLDELKLAPDSTKAGADFTFTNGTDHVVTVSQIEKTCSCLAADLKDGKKVYQPGESGTVRVDFEVGNFTGTVDKMVVVRTDDPAAPQTVLTVRAQVPVIVELEPKTVQWFVGGKPEPRKVDILMHYDKPVKILKATCSSEAFTTELKTVKEGSHYELWITPREMKRPNIGLVRLDTDCPVERHRVQQVFAVVRAERIGAPTGGQ